MTILDFLREHNVPLAPAGHRHVGRGWIGVDCVWCSPGSGGFDLGINERWGAVSCWKCGKHRLGETLREHVLALLTNDLDLIFEFAKFAWQRVRMSYAHQWGAALLAKPS